MATIGAIVSSPLIIIIVGIVFSLPILIPPLRRRLREHQQWRRLSIGLLSLLAGLFMLWFTVYIPIYNEHYLYNYPLERIRAATNNSFLLQIKPPPMRNICIMVGDVLSCYDAIAGWMGYLFMWLMILAPAVVTGFFVHRFTRDNRKQKRE